MEYDDNYDNNSTNHSEEIIYFHDGQDHLPHLKPYDALSMKSPSKHKKSKRRRCRSSSDPKWQSEAPRRGIVTAYEERKIVKVILIN